VPKYIALLGAAVLLWACASDLVADVPKAARNSQVADYPDMAERLSWRWSDREASLSHSITCHLSDDEVEISLLEGIRYRLSIRLKAGGKDIHAFEGHDETVFARWGDRLYLADFCPIASGCRVVAVNLKTGERLWERSLRGLGPIRHSKYRNRINMTTDGRVITIWGNESSGRYVELLDQKTGRTVGHKVFPENRW
jgi:hypothetical protein